MSQLYTLEDLNVTHKTVLCRVDLNVPMQGGRIEDTTRIEELVPTLQWLMARKAKIIVISHFGRPKNGFDRSLSLAPLANALGKVLGGVEVKFAVDCIGHSAQEAVAALKEGEILLLENVRFHAGEEANDPEFVKALASLADCYVNDTFSCSHRKHASIYGVARLLPSAAGKLLQKEIHNIEKVLTNPPKPMTVIIGGAKVSTKLGVLHNLTQKANNIVIGGAMANTFLKAEGYEIGTSLYEKELVGEAKSILQKAKANNCQVIVPSQVVVAGKLIDKPQTQVVPVTNIPKDSMVLDIGPAVVGQIAKVLSESKTVVWNGPLGAFEYRPFDVGTISVARCVAAYTNKGNLTSLAGGGDVVAALGAAGLTSSFTYISTAGGAFLEWLEGKELPGIEVLRKA
jgi:phosphoglycerate kinase